VPALVVKPDPKPKAKVTPGPSVPDPAIAIAAAAALAVNKAKADILKAKPCFAFQKGTCDKGKKCTFSHAKASSETPAGAGAKTYDTSKIPCRFHLKGTCEKGAQCKFKHDTKGGCVLPVSSDGLVLSAAQIATAFYMLMPCQSFSQLLQPTVKTDSPCQATRPCQTVVVFVNLLGLARRNTHGLMALS
jgi:hypothetical protein